MNIIAGITGKFDGLHRDTEDIDGIHEVAILAVYTRGARPQIPETRGSPLDRLSDVFGPALANHLRLLSQVADYPVRTCEDDRRTTLGG
ncbi:MAG: hypothetical protein OXG98_14570 [Gemmatimonadetes bacterium]|nr:hypothetical protein [Gemmatimonadota bacterium]